jgi:hypothetical protein
MPRKKIRRGKRIERKNPVSRRRNHMKKLFLLTPFIVACGMFGGEKDDGPGTKLPKSRGVFHPGPYKDPVTGKHCNAPGGFCESDQRCHSSAEKCPFVK